LVVGGAQAAPQPAEIDAIFADLDAGGAGCAAGAEQGGTALFTKAWGAADIATGRPLSATARFYMASVSKQVTALTVLEVVKSGRMSLKAPITTYIPELPAYLNEVTLYDLLTHTSGVRDYFGLALLEGMSEDQVVTEADVIAAVSRQKSLNFPRGSEFLYSNSGYVLLAIAAERVTGKSFDALAREELFGPLGMSGTFFQHHHDAPIPERVHGYVKKDGVWKISDSHLDVVGDGGLYSNVDDMLKWLANLDAGTVGAASLQIMEQPAKTNDGALTGMGMGLAVSVSHGLKVVEHGGALAGYRTADLWLPSAKLGVVVLCNFAEADPSTLAHRVAALYAPALADAPTTPAPVVAATVQDPATLAHFAGAYVGPGGSTLKIVLEGDHLVLKAGGATLTQKADGVFYLGSPKSGRTMTFAAGDPSPGFDLAAGERPPVHYERAPKETASAAQNAALVGDYASEEIRAAYHIRTGPKGLVLAVGAGPEAALESIGKDRFVVDGLGAEITPIRGPGGLVKGFTVGFGRVKGIVFHRV
jgi:CubicO group peptidase (beta-lactamase class C family)